MRTPRVVLLAAAAVLSASGVVTLVAGPVSAAPTPFEVTLAAANVVPAPTSPTEATLTAEVAIDTAVDDAAELCYTLTAGSTALEDPAVLFLATAAAGTEPADGTSIQLEIAALDATEDVCTDIDNTLADAIVASPADYSLIVTNTALESLVRGQLEAVTVNVTNFTAVAGASGVVTGTASDADGSAQATFSLSEAGELCQEIETTGLGAVTAVSVNAGVAGQTGPAIATIEPGTINDADATTTCLTPLLTAEVAQALRSSPANHYLTITSADGEIRGQLASQGTGSSSSSSSSTTSSTALDAGGTSSSITTTFNPKLPAAVPAGEQGGSHGAPIAGIALLGGGLALAATAGLGLRRRSA